ncbi:L-serine ammonia-lyase [Streptomyces lunaelactis]|uniref:L-serine ammonia-lyase n=2 Tax=Streptomyces lunaelactis TaxID=1535768 RepID=UPI0015853572|nr:L-serine ammonia-lyase [Streptomyces lunaelactis]NUK24854.1 L-serine ammonia-lyase [Streptomyces lunaelactis]NUK33216.1 L-serine ammonia-lyase [Streptomyces lunaelactis]NUK39711.1 L-serine ammonia-lyase [Streptomyces lunaelactis]NUK82098.1 L-serine ammonia-lyase [Streptomyces lunaelactis]NUK90653.1 L-serine ammonia-lyase [Streptomyces lunaelactis]
MPISVFDLFKVGIGPSSSHTVGPMKAARLFVTALNEDGLLPRAVSVRAELFGSLGATGHGHGSDKAVLLGLEGEDPETVDTDTVDDRVHRIRETGRLRLLGRKEVDFREPEHLVLHRRRTLPFHPNGMQFQALDHHGSELRTRTYYSVGGGFVVDESAKGADRIKPDDTPVRLPFHSASELLLRAYESGLPLSGVMLANELSWRSESEVREGLLRIWTVMRECADRGCSRTETTLPGRLKVPRRAPQLLRTLADDEQSTDPLKVMDWVNLFALAVNEENASGGRIVTAPTNGAAGIVPAVLHYYTRFVPGADEDGVVRFLLAAGAVGALFKENASISGAEVGCQGEVGSACSMAAAGLAEALGGTPEQVENAAEIGMEHNLGLTCDPVGGLVQIPCIERNAIASVKAINAARMALRGDGTHVVSLDKVIKTMRETGADMKVKYKETSRGGLAVNVIEC